MEDLEIGNETNLELENLFLKVSSMNALEKLVPKELEQHLMLNYTRFKNFEEMEAEVITYIEAKTGSKLVLSSNFAKPTSSSSSGPTHGRRLLGPALSVACRL